MDLQKTRRVITWIGVVMVVISLPGMVFSRSPQRWGHFLGFGLGALALLFAFLVIPWLERRADACGDE
jgi:CHASE1-domain containing sensor protein